MIEGRENVMPGGIVGLKWQQQMHTCSERAAKVAFETGQRCHMIFKKFHPLKLTQETDVGC